MLDRRSERAFLDTNIWLYAFIERGEEAEKSSVARALIRQVEPVVSTQVINEVCVNLLRKANFTEAQIRDLIEAFYQRCLVIPLSEEVMLMASRLRERFSLSFWDSMIVAAALSADVNILYTEDMQHGLIVEQRLEIRNPFLPHP